MEKGLENDGSSLLLASYALLEFFFNILTS
jgi:hypothetical protein